MKKIFKTAGVCARAIEIDIEDGIVKSVEFDGGCPGNLAGLSALIPGMSVESVIDRLEGIKCGHKPTSCPDQLARALRSISQ